MGEGGRPGGRPGASALLVLRWPGSWSAVAALIDSVGEGDEQRGCLNVSAPPSSFRERHVGEIRDRSLVSSIRHQGDIELAHFQNRVDSRRWSTDHPHRAGAHVLETAQILLQTGPGSRRSTAGFFLGAHAMRQDDFHPLRP